MVFLLLWAVLTVVRVSFFFLITPLMSTSATAATWRGFLVTVLLLSVWLEHGLALVIAWQDRKTVIEFLPLFLMLVTLTSAGFAALLHFYLCH